MRKLGVALPLGIWALAGCGGGEASSSRTPAQGTGAIHLASPSLKPGAAVSRQFTCDGRDISPPLRWSGVPRATRELVLVMRDRDAPGGNFIHWAIAGVPPAARGVPEGKVPSGAVAGSNSFGSFGYRGPCPPPGSSPHHYVITISALRSPSGLGKGFFATQLHAPVLASGTLSVTYGRR